MTPAHLIAVAEYLGFTAAGVFSLQRGDGTVRAAAVGVLGPGLTVWALAGSPARLFVPYMEATPLFVGADVISLALMLTAALPLVRPPAWLFWACAFQLATVAAHVVRALDRNIHDVALAAAAKSWWLLQVLAVLWGAADVDLRRRPTTNAIAVQTTA